MGGLLQPVDGTKDTLQSGVVSGVVGTTQAPMSARKARYQTTKLPITPVKREFFSFLLSSKCLLRGGHLIVGVFSTIEQNSFMHIMGPSHVKCEGWVLTKTHVQVRLIKD